ncbi:hypothetical protein P9498_26830, partial [Klebsiella pneumoniae]
PWACIVARPDSSHTVGHARDKEVLDYVNERVSGYKKLRGVCWMENLPRTASGKVLKRELRKFVAREQ